jgi:hypothetical protein
MRTATGAKSVRKAFEVGLVNLVKDRRRGSARATYTQAITNLSDEPLGIFIGYTIPRLEATISPGSVIGVSSVQPFADARLNVAVRDAAGAELSRDRISTYQLGRAPPPPGEDGIFRSADLADEQGDGFPISAAGVRGVEYGPFEGTRLLPTIPFLEERLFSISVRGQREHVQPGTRVSGIPGRSVRHLCRRRIRDRAGRARDHPADPRSACRDTARSSRTSPLGVVAI